MPPVTSHLVLRKLEKRFGAVVALDGVSLAVEAGEFVSLLGPSGCGKTTLLRIAAGLETPDAGSVELDGDDITALPPYRRRMGMVFQVPALFPNLRVRDNVAFGLRVAGQAGAPVAERVRALLDLAGLAGRADRFPHQLSGGEQQRVALARALAVEPRMLLLDEPLAALDAPLRATLRTEIRRIHQRLHVTTLYVTHDQEEALSVSDRVVVMNQGRIEEVGRPRELYRTPQSAFTAVFIGSATHLLGWVASQAEGTVAVGPLRFRSTDATRFATGTRVRILVRAEAVRLLGPDTPAPAATNCVEGTLVVKGFRGPLTLLEVDVEGALIRAEAPSDVADDLELGAPLRLAIPHAACRIFETVPGEGPGVV